MLDKWKKMTSRQIEDTVDKGLRHRSGVIPQTYLTHWLSIARDFAFATHDDSWGEFEKEFSIIISSLVRSEKRYENLVKALKDKRDRYMIENFVVDPETGASESSRIKEEYVAELDETIEFVENFTGEA